MFAHRRSAQLDSKLLDAGLTLVLVGVVTTIPLAINLLGKDEIVSASTLRVA